MAQEYMLVCEWGCEKRVFDTVHGGTPEETVEQARQVVNLLQEQVHANFKELALVPTVKGTLYHRIAELEAVPAEA